MYVFTLDLLLLFHCSLMLEVEMMCYDNGDGENNSVDDSEVIEMSGDSSGHRRGRGGRRWWMKIGSLPEKLVLKPIFLLC